MKHIGLFVLISLLNGCALSTEREFTRDGRFNSTCDICFVTTSHLAITPERYHNKIVQVYGTLGVGFEGVHVISGEFGIWVNLTSEQYERYKELDGKEGYVRGVFDGNDLGHLGMYYGSINEVTRFGG